MSSVIFRSAITFALTASVATLAGCASTSTDRSVTAPGPTLTGAAAQPAASDVPGVRRTASAADGLRDTAQELGSARQTVGEAIAALREVTTAQGDLIAPLDRFIALNAQLDEADKRLGERGEDMRTRARDYITNWEVEVYGVEDPELRKQAEQRRSRVRADYGKIADATRSLRESMDPFLRQIDDLQTFLSNDLTQSGVRAAAPAVDRAQRSGEELQRKIDSLVTELNRVASEMAPEAPATNNAAAAAPDAAPGGVAPANDATPAAPADQRAPRPVDTNK